MELIALDLFRLRIPFLLPVKHSLAERQCSECLILRVRTDSGVYGYGEGTPRKYVTGETIEENMAVLKDRLWPEIKRSAFTDKSALLQLLTWLSSQSGAVRNPSALCALEMAVLDAAGKEWGQSVSQLLGLACREGELTYSAVVSMLPVEEFAKYMHMVKEWEMKSLKLKVGDRSDPTRLAMAREILGEKMDIRVDANCAWTPEEAIERIAGMRNYGISAVEQPVAKKDFAGLKKVMQDADIPVIADESVCSIDDARCLAEMGACTAFNIRLSKCGGFLNALEILNVAREAAINSILGCHVGETGILSAAGRHFAQSFDDLVYAEGSFSSLVLKEDIIREDIIFGKGGLASPLRGPGLGINVREDILDKYVVKNAS